jgi:hypothetical protein
MDSHLRLPFAGTRLEAEGKPETDRTPREAIGNHSKPAAERAPLESSKRAQQRVLTNFKRGAHAFGYKRCQASTLPPA